MSDDEFLTAFESCSLPREEWTHAAHIRMAWLYLTRLPLDEARERVRVGIRRYNEAGGSRGYHETITQAFVLLIHSRAASGSFADFCALNPDLLDRALGALRKHYSRERLESDAARTTFLAADLEPLP